MTFPKLTVITPSFQQADYLEETLLSVLNQRYPNLEYIVIDGGSTDESPEILEKHDRSLSYWTSCKDRGQGHAINKGLERATGEIVAYLNSDDLYLPGALNKVVSYMAEHPECNWLSGSCLTFGAGESVWQAEAPEELWRWLDRCPLPQASVFWRRELTTRLGGFDETFRCCLDYEYWARFAFAGERCHILDHPLSAFRAHPAAKTASLHSQFRAEDEVIRQRYSPHLAPQDQRKLQRQIYRGQDCMRLAEAVELAQTNHRLDAWIVFVETVRTRPEAFASRAGLGCLRQLIAANLRA